jgi:transposase
MRDWVHGNHRRPVSPNQAVFADTTGQRDARQSARPERHLVRRRAGGQRARSTHAVRQLAHRFGSMPRPIHLLRERAYEGDETRQRAVDVGPVPVMPPQPNRLAPWEYYRAMSTRRNERARLFHRLKGFRRIVSRFDKLDVMFVAFINFALIVDSLRSG